MASRTTKRKSPTEEMPSEGRKSATGKYLVIVESPAKAKTINKYLGRDFVVKASMGHIRDLPGNGLAIDIENGFAPTYELVPGRKKIIGELRKHAGKSTAVYLATDLDREGEAIAWHLAKALELDENMTQRVVFNEITQKAIREAFAQPCQIDMDKVNAQQARRVLDRIVGYELSPLLWKKVAKGLSAGRVQSVAVRMVVEREQEIRAFIPQEYWTITGFFALSMAQADQLAPEWERFLAGGDDPDKSHTQKEILEWISGHKALQASLVSIDGKPFKPVGLYEGAAAPDSAFTSAVDQARQVAEALGFVVEELEEHVWTEYAHRGLRVVDLVGRLDRNALPPFRVADIQTRRTRSKPNAPFTTATLQQAASTQLGFSTTRTMKLAQQLYEGVEFAGEDGPVGLITYMRTDSTNLSTESVEAARSWIKSNCGDKYLPDRPQIYESRKRAQEAHEAIRPTDAARDPESLKKQLSEPLFKLYNLIWRRFISCQMTAAEWDSTAISITTPTKIGEMEFKATGRTLAFDGFYRVAGLPKSNGDQALLPEVRAGQEVVPFDIEPEQQFTSPPARYTEASLVKRLEAEGIGRPSTYASIIQTIQDRGYVEQIDRRLYATDKGSIVTEKLLAHFPDVMEYKFTSFMEDELDKIEEAHLDWVKVLHEFYDPFHRDLLRAHEEMEPVKAEPSPYKCELCGGDMVYRWARTGRFLSCTKYPKCKGAMNVDREGRPVGPQKIDVACELCGKDMILRQSRHGSFLGCSGYPACRHTIACDEQGVPFKLVKEEELEQPCPACGVGTMKVRRRGMRAFLGCDQYPTCKNTLPLPEGIRLERKEVPVVEAGFNCERCGRPMHIKSGRRGQFIACSGFPACRNAKPIEKLDALRAEAPANGLQTVPSDIDTERDSQANASTTGRKTVSKGKTKIDGAASDTLPPGFALTRTGKPVVETWPEKPLSCPQCGHELNLKAGRFGPFFSCSNFPRCKCSVNLRGEAKKRAEIEMPAPQRAKPIPTEIACDECGEMMMIREGRSGKFLGCSKYPKCKFTKPLPPDMSGTNGAS
ncbi:MAG: type I DNA topoisomerase [Phycisphaerales bacterium]|nr:type I DNA topoisomerase [Phycisphaerales bacterium]